MPPRTIFNIKGWDLSEYAISANAILGIRDSGKTYTGTEAAEELFDAHVPFIAFDPIGVWHSLRIPGRGKGYPVVVAGGKHGDLPLTRKNAGTLVRAAMTDGISLVLDLFSIEMTKADWRAIVREAVEILLHENSEHGLRHVFIEEAAEFVPQRVQDGQVFAAVEKLVRMGGNSKLGCTLINQRSADLNKSVLELCANVFVHRQTGKNTLLDLKKWLEVMALSKAEQDKIADSLPDLKSGHCWAFVNDLKRPIRLQIPAKNSQHPDRRAVMARGAAQKKPVAADAFVAQMNAKLAEKEKPKAAPAAPSIAAAKRGTPDARLKDRDAAFQTGVKQGRESGYPEGWAAGHQVGFQDGFRAALKAAAAMGQPDYAAPPPPKRIPPSAGGGSATASEARAVPSTARTAPIASTPRPSGSAGQRILNGLRELEVMGVGAAPRVLVAMMAGYSNLTSKGFVNAIGGLRSGGQVEYTSDGVALTATGRREAIEPEGPMTTETVQARIVGLLGGASGKILTPLIDAYPGAMNRQEVASAAGYGNLTSKGFVNAIGRLRTLGFVDYPSSGEVIATKLLFPEAA